MKGRKPKPTAFRVIEGNREHRPLNMDEPKPDPVCPPKPRFMGREARKAWRYLCHELGKMGTLGSSDQGIMTAYCAQWEIMTLAQNRLHEIAREKDRKHSEKADGAGQDKPVARMSTGDWSEAMLVISSKGTPIQSPLLGIVNAAWEKITRYATLLGLSPTERARMHLEKPKGKSLREELMA